MRADARANREQIVETAKTLFHERGIKVPFRTIAVRANVGVATLHRHFPDRESLVHAVAELVHNNIRTMMAEHLSAWPMDPWGAWTRFVQELADRGIAMADSSSAEPTGETAREPTGETDEEEYPVAVAHRHSTDKNVQPLEEILTKARQYGYVPRDLELHDFMFGITVVSRPNTTQRMLSEQRRWLIITYLDGLRSQASRY